MEPYLVTSAVEGGAQRSSSGLLFGGALLANAGIALGPGVLELAGSFAYISHQDGVFELGGPNLNIHLGYQLGL